LIYALKKIFDIYIDNTFFNYNLTMYLPTFLLSFIFLITFDISLKPHSLKM